MILSSITSTGFTFKAVDIAVEQSHVEQSGFIEESVIDTLGKIVDTTLDVVARSLNTIIDSVFYSVGEYIPEIMLFLTVLAGVIIMLSGKINKPMTWWALEMVVSVVWRLNV